MALKLINSMAQRHFQLSTLFKFLHISISEVSVLFLRQLMVQVGYSYFRAYDPDNIER